LKKQLIIVLAFLFVLGCSVPSIRPFSFLGLNFGQNKESLLAKGFECESESSSKTADFNCVKNIDGRKITVNLLQNNVIRSIESSGYYTGEKKTCDNSLFAVENLLTRKYNASLSYETINVGKSIIRVNDKTMLINGEKFAANDGPGKLSEKIDYNDNENEDVRKINFFIQCIVIDKNKYMFSVKFENENASSEDFAKTLNFDYK